MRSQLRRCPTIGQRFTNILAFLTAGQAAPPGACRAKVPTSQEVNVASERPVKPSEAAIG
jgi:hypothetical protein